VLLVIPQLDVGGAETQLVRLATRLHGEGFAAEVAVFTPDGDLESQLTGAGVPVHHVRRRSKAGIEAVLDLRRILRAGRFDIVHSFLWPANWRARLAGLLAATPILVASPRGVDTWMQLPHVLVDRILALGTDAIVVNAEAVRDYLVRREKIPPRLIRVIPNGINAGLFSSLPSREEARARLGLPPRDPVVLIVGNLRPDKGHEDFLRTAAIVKETRPRTLFVVVGDGERRGPLEALASELGLGAAVQFAGHQADVGPYLAACDVAMNTSPLEGCCNAIIEAMAAGRPVVAYAVGGNPELVASGETGRLVARGDLEGLARAVVSYIDDPQLGASHGEAGARRVSQTLSIETMTKRTADLYRELRAVNGGGGATS
jgi:glycosyltransferase involved in cell wall biosynthesis